MKNIIKNIARRVVKRLGRSAPAENSHVIQAIMTAVERKILAEVRPFTMTSDERVLSVIDAVRYLSLNSIPGAFVECGVWKGGSSMASALTLLEAGDISRELYLFDTFSGMTSPTKVDQSYDGVAASHQLEAAPVGTGIWCMAGLEEVKANLASTAYPIEKMHFIQGKVEDTIPKTCPETIALLRLDTDWYESTRHELIHLFPRIATGGILIIDDYGHWDGAKLATDEYMATNNIRIFLHRIDYTGRIAVKL